MRFDYSKIKADQELAETMAKLSNRQLDRIAKMIKTFKESEDQQQEQERKKWMADAVTAILRDFAEKTNSVLEIEQNEESMTLQACLGNEIGFDILDEPRGIKLALQMADYVGIDAEDGTVTLHLEYS